MNNGTTLYEFLQIHIRERPVFAKPQKIDLSFGVVFCNYYERDLPCIVAERMLNGFKILPFWGSLPFERVSFFGAAYGYNCRVYNLTIEEIKNKYGLFCSKV